MKNEKNKFRRINRLYWEYLCWFSLLDISLQCELSTLPYSKFRKLHNPRIYIDNLIEKVYN